MYLLSCFNMLVIFDVVGRFDQFSGIAPNKSLYNNIIIIMIIVIIIIIIK